MTELSAYEQQRLSNIAANEAQLTLLGLSSIVPAAPKSQPRPRRPKREQHTAVPERRSSRVQGAAAPDVYIASETSGGLVTLGGNAKSLELQKEREALIAAEKAAHADPLVRFGMGAMPEGEDELLEGAEKKAFAALYKVKRAKAVELKLEGYKIAQHRSLAEVVRRMPTTEEELAACWGFGGSGVRLRKYGEMFLDALRPHVDKVRASHEAMRPEAERRLAAAEAGKPIEAAPPEASGSGKPVVLDDDNSDEEVDNDDDDEDAPLATRRAAPGAKRAKLNRSASDAWDSALGTLQRQEAREAREAKQQKLKEEKHATEEEPSPEPPASEPRRTRAAGGTPKSAEVAAAAAAPRSSSKKRSASAEAEAQAAPEPVRRRTRVTSA
tara:strand:- start:2662 stop:3813 length:1152 start_codon:yes stop_codon:yes gene_type:complete